VDCPGQNQKEKEKSFQGGMPVRLNSETIQLWHFVGLSGVRMRRVDDGISMLVSAKLSEISFQLVDNRVPEATYCGGCPGAVSKISCKNETRNRNSY